MHSFDLDIANALRTLRSGGLVLYPTDTVWGIGCDATDAKAVDRIYQLKERSESKSLIVLAADLEMMRHYVKKIPGQAMELMEETTRPLTIIYQQARNLAPNTIAPDGSIAIRIPKDAYCQQLLEAFGKPIISTSANVSGEPTPQNFAEIGEAICTGVDYVVLHRQQDRTPAQPSKIVLLKDDEVKVIRN